MRHPSIKKQYLLAATRESLCTATKTTIAKIFLEDGSKGTFLVAQMVKNLSAMWETWVRPLGWEDCLEEGMAIQSSILAWRIPMDRGAWQSTVCSVVKNRTGLK